MLNKFQVKVKLIEPLLGTIPKNKEHFLRFVSKKAKDEGVPEANLVEEMSTAQEVLDSVSTTFHKDDQGWFLYDYYIKGFFCETAKHLQAELTGTFTKTKMKELIAPTMVKRYCFIRPRRIRLNVGAELQTLTRPLRRDVWNVSGPTMTLVSSDTIPEGTEIDFEIHTMEVAGFNADVLKTILEHGQYQGFGAWRTGGYGRFELVDFSEI